ncbi:thiamine diphosphokinase [Deinococcus radiophilus]|uniref:Thiamine diphosphokinase n=1 Tax=Deinococcus radiophilus TaxID=32062 RepID=A0A3S0ICT1_9DEIO|nr:thiamine diphosphokinase [Deinococcus radiophilus]RTR30732.1 thiamine diphosphokinase [Deinococcus radiophilus]UFA51286.1 thiamine diphosphokinase [Deinococcus radiophilus]
MTHTSSAAKTAYLLVAGRLTLPADLCTFPPPDLVIAADGGARHAAGLGLNVDAWVGDFDSAQGDELDVARKVHPTAKDETDGELATQLALAQGCTRLVFVGAFGGRFDHAAALLLGAVRLAERGVDVWLTSGDEHARPLIPGRPLALALPTGTTLSVVAVSDLQGLSLDGVRWPLTGADVPLGSGWTLSNQSRGQVRAELEQGRALLVWHTLGD